LKAEQWEPDLPAERFGEWRWQVSVVSEGKVLVSSDEQMFWFDPFLKEQD
jgi:hypothetical protein